MSVDTEGQETYDTLNCEGEKNSLENDQKKSVNASLFCTWIISLFSPWFNVNDFMHKTPADMSFLPSGSAIFPQTFNHIRSWSTCFFLIHSMRENWKVPERVIEFRAMHCYVLLPGWMTGLKILNFSYCCNLTSTIPLIKRTLICLTRS